MSNVPPRQPTARVADVLGLKRLCFLAICARDDTERGARVSCARKRESAKRLVVWRRCTCASRSRLHRVRSSGSSCWRNSLEHECRRPGVSERTHAGGGSLFTTHMCFMARWNVPSRSCNNHNHVRK